MTIIKVSKIQLASIDNALHQGLRIEAIKAIRETNRQPPAPGQSQLVWRSGTIACWQSSQYRNLPGSRKNGGFALRCM